jgi:hypothetical protein
MLEIAPLSSRISTTIYFRSPSPQELVNYAAGTGDEGFSHPEQKTGLIEDAGTIF